METTERSAGKNKAIPTREGLSYKEFTHEYLFPNRPVILTDGIKNWPALGKWTPDFFRTHYPTKKINVKYDRAYLVPEFIDLVERSDPARPAPYFRNEQVREVFPELLEDLKPEPCYIQPNWLKGPLYPTAGREAEIYIGGAGRSFPVLHYDANSTHAFLAQIHGDKEAILFSPDETHLMYAREQTRHQSHITDVSKVDLKKFPLFAQATAYTAVLKPGHLLFIPSRWWHSARMLSTSITVSYNVANRSNWKGLKDEVLHHASFGHPLRKPAYATYLTLLGWAKTVADFLPGGTPAAEG